MYKFIHKFGEVKRLPYFCVLNKTMGLFITIGVAAVSFIAGALVFRNNSAKFEPIVQKGKEELAEAKAEIEKLKESIKQLIETQHPTSP